MLTATHAGGKTTAGAHRRHVQVGWGLGFGMKHYQFCHLGSGFELSRGVAEPRPVPTLASLTSSIWKDSVGGLCLDGGS